MTHGECMTEYVRCRRLNKALPWAVCQLYRAEGRKGCKSCKQQASRIRDAVKEAAAKFREAQ